MGMRNARTEEVTQPADCKHQRARLYAVSLLSIARIPLAILFLFLGTPSQREHTEAKSVSLGNHYPV